MLLSCELEVLSAARDGDDDLIRVRVGVGVGVGVRVGVGVGVRARARVRVRVRVKVSGIRCCTCHLSATCAPLLPCLRPMPLTSWRVMEASKLVS